MGSLDSDCSGLKGLWMYASVGICAACGVMLHTFFHLFCVDDFVHCFNGLFRHLTTAQQDITVCAMCYAISRSPFILLWWNFFPPNVFTLTPKSIIVAGVRLGDSVATALLSYFICCFFIYSFIYFYFETFRSEDVIFTWNIQCCCYCYRLKQW